MNAARFALFLGTVLAIWTAMHGYLVQRAWALIPSGGPWPRRAVVLLGIFLWILYPLGRIAARFGVPGGAALETAGAAWIGVLFLAVSALLAADLVTGFGFLLPRAVPAARSAALLLAGLLAIVALVQAARGPSLREERVELAGLPPALDGMVLVQISDLHLGTILGSRWLEKRLEEVRALSPALIAVTGDLVDGEADSVERFLPALRRLKAPLGVWAVTGNHEFYAGLDRSVALLEAAGFRVLRDEWAEAAPGLIIAGVDDLTARRQFGLGGDPLGKALGGRKPGACVFLSHSPLKEDEAERLGAGLMLSGHTHAGQVWPFGEVVRLRYPYLAGRYRVGKMALIVSRGAGTWGPPMRLFRRGEIVRVTLAGVNSAKPGNTTKAWGMFGPQHRARGTGSSNRRGLPSPRPSG